MQEMISYANQRESTRRILAKKDDIGQVNLKEYDFNLLLWQTAYDKLSGEGIDNYKIPERIGKWFAFTRSRSDGGLQEFTRQDLNIGSSQSFVKDFAIDGGLFDDLKDQQIDTIIDLQNVSL